MNTPDKQLLGYHLSLSVATYEEFWCFSIKDLTSSKYTTASFFFFFFPFYKGGACVCMCVEEQLVNCF